MQRTENTDIRILTWNILSEELTPGVPTICERMPEIVKFIRENDPDAAGIQEISEEAYAMFDKYLGDTYELVNPMTKEGNYSFTGVMYNKLRYRLLDSDIENYPLGNRRIRVANWIYIENIETSYRLVLLSTHWDRHACNRVPQAEYMADMVKALEERFGCGVITVGDYNALEESCAFKTFISRSGYKDAKYCSNEVVNNRFTGHDIGNPEPQKEGTQSIDHITMNDVFDVLHYENVITPELISTSDHLPVYVDLKIK